MGVTYFDLCYYAAGTVLAAGGLWLAWWALWRDQARGRRRCPRCWYDLRGTPGLRCSECGYTARRERRLHRTRRYWRAAFVSSVLMAGGALSCLWPIVSTYGWLSIVPTKILLMFLPQAENVLWEPPAYSRVARELDRRNADKLLDSRDASYLLQHKVRIVTRPRWPVGVPLYFRVQSPAWDQFIPFLLTDGTLLKPRSNRCDSEIASRTPGNPYYGHDACVGVPTECGPNISVQWRCWRERQPALFAVVNYPVSIVPTINDAMRPVRGRHIDKLMRDAIRVGVFQTTYHDDGTNTLVVQLGFNPSSAETKSIGFGFGATLIRSGDILGHATFTPMFTVPPPDFGWPEATNMAQCTFQNIPRVAEAIMRSEQWMLQIRGDGVAALLDWDHDAYWDGEFSIPFVDLPK